MSIEQAPKKRKAPEKELFTEEIQPQKRAHHRPSAPRPAPSRDTTIELPVRLSATPGNGHLRAASQGGFGAEAIATTSNGVTGNTFLSPSDLMAFTPRDNVVSMGSGALRNTGAPSPKHAPLLQQPFPDIFHSASRSRPTTHLPTHTAMSNLNPINSSHVAPGLPPTMPAPQTQPAAGSSDLRSAYNQARQHLARLRDPSGRLLLQSSSDLRTYLEGLGAAVSENDKFLFDMYRDMIDDILVNGGFLELPKVV